MRLRLLSTHHSPRRRGLNLQFWEHCARWRNLSLFVFGIRRIRSISCSMPVRYSFPSSYSFLLMPSNRFACYFLAGANPIFYEKTKNNRYEHFCKGTRGTFEAAIRGTAQSKVHGYDDGRNYQLQFAKGTDRGTLQTPRRWQASCFYPAPCCRAEG